MNIKCNLRKITELGIGLTAVAILALAGCGGGGGGGSSVASVVVSTFAGTSGSYAITDGTGTAARFFTPTYIASDGTNLYVTDWSANNIRKIVISTGAVTTIAGSINGASGTANTSTGPGTAALFNRPEGIATDGTNLYVADTNSHTIRKIVIATEVVSTLAGTGVVGSPNAASAIPGTSAGFNYPAGISLIGTNLYVADSANSTIRKIDLNTASNAVSTLAGTAGAYGYSDSTTGASAVFNTPTGLTTDGTSLFVTEYGNNDVRKIDPLSGATTLVAGNYLAANSGIGSTDAIGSSARFNNPWGISTDGTNLYVADTNNHTIRKIVIATGFVSTPAGAALVPGMADGAGPSAHFNFPWGIIYVNGALYVADYLNGSIRKIQL